MIVNFSARGDGQVRDAEPRRGGPGQQHAAVQAETQRDRASAGQQGAELEVTFHHEVTRVSSEQRAELERMPPWDQEPLADFTAVARPAGFDFITLWGGRIQREG